MAVVLKSLFHGYKNHFSNDPEGDCSNLMLQSPLPTVAIVVSYLYFVRKWGPKFMENRKPFQLYSVMRAYNLLQVVINLYIMIAVGVY